MKKWGGKMAIEWVAYCQKCGEIGKAFNGDVVEALAKNHKRLFLDHEVIFGTYITAELAVLSLI